MSPVEKLNREPTPVPFQLVVHCLLECKNGQWQAFSLEFGLAAQADTEAGVKHKLENMISSYLFDALVGEDRQHAAALLRRKATFAVRMRYFCAWALSKIFGNHRNGKSHVTYDEPVRLVPESYAIP